MHWLSRKDSKVSPERSGGLQGATVVRTPEDALRNTNVRVTYVPGAKPPPLSPSLPVLEEDEAALPEDETPKPLQESPRPPSPAPSSSSSFRPSLKSRSSTAVEDSPPHVPPVPLHIPLSAPIPPFSPVLVSGPSGQDFTDPSKFMVSLETCTTTYKSTLSTLCSRPSFLADYLNSLVKLRTSQASSVYSAESADVEAYRGPLTSQGLLQAAACSTFLHIFLDRLSAPYAHILTFLRTPSISADYPSTLPRGVQLSSPTNSTSSTLFNTKLEALLELRDEAAYIGLDSLHRLCTDEIRQRLAHAQRHARGASVNAMVGPGLLPSPSGGSPSIHSLHTLIERVEGGVTVCNDKDTLACDSKYPESFDEVDTLPPLGIPTSPPPMQTTIIQVPPSPKPASMAPRHSKSTSILSQPTTIQSPKLPTKPTLKPPSNTPPRSASSSPGQAFARPPYHNHKKAESTSMLPLRSAPLISDIHGPVGSPKRPERKSRRRTGEQWHHVPHHASSPVGDGAVLSPGWI